MLADSIVALEGGSYTMSTDDTFIKQQWQDQEALHRFQLISPLLQTGLMMPDACSCAERSLMRTTFLSARSTGMKSLCRKTVRRSQTG